MAISIFEKVTTADSRWCEEFGQIRLIEALKVVAYFVLHSNLSMNRPVIKTSVIAILSFVLLYYSVAWAVLRCAHEEDHSDHAMTPYDAGVRGGEQSGSWLGPLQANLDCPGPTYHVESLAGPSAPSELLRLLRDFTPNIDLWLHLSSVTREEGGDIRLKALANEVSSPIPSIQLPAYLSLSVLRF